jgi:hypothetical protein
MCISQSVDNLRGLGANYKLIVLPRLLADRAPVRGVRLGRYGRMASNQGLAKIQGSQALR